MAVTAPTRGFVADPYLSLEAYPADADLVTLSLGPQHPSTHGVFRIVLHMDGEIIVKAVPHAGYLHRGVEKLCEKLSYSNLVPILDKNDYVAPLINEQAAVLAFEKLMGVEAPLRARVLRTLLAELQRVASHLLWLGTFAIDLGGAMGGGTTVFMYCFREREQFDLLGVKFDGHPDLRRLMMPDEWEGHPLRKDYAIDTRCAPWR